MFLHHAVTLPLFVCFLLANQMAIGSIIAVLHDVPDIFIQISRTCNSVGFKKATPFFFVLVLLTWSLRIFVLPVYTISIMSLLKPPTPALQPLVYTEAAYLWVLIVLHYYWIYMMLKMFYRLVTTGEQRDTVNDVQTQHTNSGAVFKPKTA